MILAIFEDECYPNFFPITLTRPVYEMKVGTTSLREKILAKIRVEDKTMLYAREYLADVQRERTPQLTVNDYSPGESLLMVNGLVVPDESFERVLEKASRPGVAVVKGGRVVAAHIRREKAESPEFVRAVSSAEGITKVLLDSASQRLEAGEVRLLEYPWELIELNSSLLVHELRRYEGREWEGEADQTTVIYGDRSRVWLARGAFVEGHTVLDTREGPIYVGENTYVQSSTRISGPAYIGRDCIVFGGQIRKGCSIGDVCRVGGELEETIFHGYSNKRHYGFMGHSYVCEWVNLGAGTTNSNLKNTYGTVRMEVCGRKIDTGRLFVGAFIGDHAKSAVGTYIYSGKRIGVSSHLYGLVTEDVPSFTIYARKIGAGMVEVDLDSALEVARRVMSRRGVKPTEAYEGMLRRVFEITRQERVEAGVSRERFTL